MGGRHLYQNGGFALAENLWRAGAASTIKHGVANRERLGTVGDPHAIDAIEARGLISDPAR